ncbi:hypothetical protein BN126380001 [Stenotrophomonas maltophilia]|nr:hypothetical protein BN126380001 [Stenotrophomonas maltophilia]
MTGHGGRIIRPRPLMLGEWGPAGLRPAPAPAPAPAAVESTVSRLSRAARGFPVAHGRAVD